MTIRLGPFQLLQPIGKGGMGVVWRGQHVDTGVHVAVKVITQRVSRDERTLSAFKNEVRAVAALQHPGVVWVVDYGEVDAKASRASEHQLITGSPYLVMEMASGGTLSTHQSGMPWFQLKRVLKSLLDALAHAHARGVIHRDLKPGNILICGPNDLRPGLKLTDFGIAHAREETVSHSMSNHVIGTLHYMAPEQIRADWRDYGPWTDLYALGTIAYRMASGRLPFKGKRGASLMVAQMNHRPPPLDALHPMPEGFEDWLLTMMRKEHWRRFQCAADAALALDALVDPMPSSGLNPGSLHPVALGTVDLLDDPPTTLILHTREIADSVELTAEVGPSPLIDSTSVEAARKRGELDRVRPPLPEHWSRDDTLPVDQLRGAGLGLWGLRAIPLVGRVAERDAIWSALREVEHSRQARLVIVRGAKGVGKSALVQWLCERAVEIGVAHRFRCSYGQDEGIDEGLRRMFRRFFRVARLDAEQRRQRVLDVCDTFGESDASQAARVERLLDPVDVNGTDAGARHQAARWFFSRVASDRPLVFWVDDAHNALDALKLIGGVLKAQKTSPTRMLAVLTVDQDALANNPLEASFLESLQKHDATVVIDVPPLTDQEMYELAMVHLGLAPALAEKVTAGAAGMPQFMVQLVGDWVQKQALERSPKGLILHKGQGVPTTMKQVWEDRVDQILQGLPPMAQQLLERAAVLGMDVVQEEWIAVCDGETPRQDHAGWRAELLDRLFGMNLAEEQEAGFRFVNEEFRNTLLQRSRAHKRYVTHNRAIARALRRSVEPAPERLGMHLLAAGELNAAVDALLAGVRNRVASVGPRAALPLVDVLDSALQEANLPTSDPCWGRLWLVRADLATQRGRLEPALKWAKKVEQAAKQHGWVGLGAMSLFTQARVALFRNEQAQAEERFAAFETMAISNAHALHRAAARHARSLLAEEDRSARSHAVACMEWLEHIDANLVDVWRVLGTRSLLASRALSLRDHLVVHGHIYESDGKREGLGEAWTMIAGAMRRAKKAEEAVGALEQALRVFRAGDSDQAQRAQLQLATLKLGRGDPALAERLASEVLHEVDEQRHRKPLALRARSVLAACAALDSRWGQLDEHLGCVQRLSAETGLVEREVAWCLTKAGEAARRSKNPEQAVRAWELAWEHYRGLGDEGQARRLHTLIARFNR